MGSGSIERSNVGGCFIEGPEANFDANKGVQVVESFIEFFWGDHDDGLMGKVAIAGCLLHGFAPVAQLHFKSPAGWFSHLQKSIRGFKVFLGKGTPGNGQQIGDAIAVYGDFAHEKAFSFGRTAMDLVGLDGIGSGKGYGEVIFSGSNSFALMGKIGTRFCKNILGNDHILHSVPHSIFKFTAPHIKKDAQTAPSSPSALTSAKEWLLSEKKFTHFTVAVNFEPRFNHVRGDI